MLCKLLKEFRDLLQIASVKVEQVKILYLQVFDVPVPFCLNKLYRTDCPIDCRAEEDDHVCGSDGNIYRNQCELEKITCGYA